jgi:hypothetical protein
LKNAKVLPLCLLLNTDPKNKHFISKLKKLNVL